MLTGSDSAPQAIQVRLCVSADDWRLVGQLAEKWLSEGLRLIDQSGNTAMMSRFTAQPRELDMTNGSVYGMVYVSELDGDRTWRFSDDSWATVRAAVGSAPLNGGCEFSTVHVEEVPRVGPVPSMGKPYARSICSVISVLSARWVELELRTDDPGLCWTPEGQMATEEFLLDMAQACDPCYGEVSFATDGVLALEEALLRPAALTVPMARQVLRSYSWITIIPAELCCAIGGIDVLSRSGAFADVKPLAAGGAWVKATSDWAAYGRADALNVVRTLAAILPTGTPRIHAWISRNQFAEADARTFAPLWNS